MDVKKIKFDKELYDGKVEVLKGGNDRINTYMDSYLNIGENTLQGAQQMYDIYYDIKKIIQDYSWAMDDVILKMEGVGETLAQIDQMMFTDMVGKGQVY